MAEIISKEEFAELMKIKGEIRGVGLKGDAEFIKMKRGDEALKKLDEELAKMNSPIKYNEIKTMGFYSLNWDAINLLLIQRLFNFTEEEIKEMGGFLAKTSLILRLSMRYFVSLSMIAKEAPKIWRKNYSVGDLSVVEFSEEKRYLLLRLENFYYHPLHCLLLIGYFRSVVNMIVGKPVICEERKCIFKGDSYHEFLLRW